MGHLKSVSPTNSLLRGPATGREPFSRIKALNRRFMRQTRPLLANLSNTLRFTLTATLALPLFWLSSPVLTRIIQLSDLSQPYWDGRRRAKLSPPVRQARLQYRPAREHFSSRRRDSAIFTGDAHLYYPRRRSNRRILQPWDVGYGIAAARLAVWVTTAYSAGVTAATQAAGSTGTGVITSSSAGGYYNFANGVTGSSADRAAGWLSSSGFTSPRQLICQADE